jgi:hypothetical protein
MRLFDAVSLFTYTCAHRAGWEKVRCGVVGRKADDILNEHIKKAGRVELQVSAAVLFIMRSIGHDTVSISAFLASG